MKIVSLLLVGTTTVQVAVGADGTDCNGLVIKSKSPAQAAHDRRKYQWKYIKENLLLDEADTVGRQLGGRSLIPPDGPRAPGGPGGMPRPVMHLADRTEFALWTNTVPPFPPAGGAAAPLPAVPAAPAAGGVPAGVHPGPAPEPAPEPEPMGPAFDEPPFGPPPLMPMDEVRGGDTEPAPAFLNEPEPEEPIAADFEEAALPTDIAELRYLAAGCSAGASSSSGPRRLGAPGFSRACMEKVKKYFGRDSTLTEEQMFDRLEQRRSQTNLFGKTVARGMVEDATIPIAAEEQMGVRVAAVADGAEAALTDTLAIFGSVAEFIPGLDVLATLFMALPMLESLGGANTGPNLEQTWKVLKPMVDTSIKKNDLKQHIQNCHDGIHDVFESGQSLMSKQYLCEPNEYTSDDKYQNSIEAAERLIDGTMIDHCSTKDATSDIIGSFALDFEFYKNNNLGPYLAVVSAQFQNAYKWALLKDGYMGRVKTAWQSHYRAFYLDWILSTGKNSFVSQYMRYRLNAAQCNVITGPKHCQVYQGGRAYACFGHYWTEWSDNTGYTANSTQIDRKQKDTGFCFGERIKLRHRVRMEAMHKVNKLLKYAGSIPREMFDEGTKSHSCLFGGRATLCAPVPKAMDSSDDDFFNFSWRKFSSCSFWKEMQEEHGTKYGTMYDLSVPVDDPMLPKTDLKNFIGKQLHCRDLGKGKIEVVPMSNRCDIRSFGFLGLDRQRSLCNSWKGCFLDPVKNTCHTTAQALSVATRYSFCARNSSVKLPEYPITCGYTNNTVLEWTSSKSMPRVMGGIEECRKLCLADKDCKMFSSLPGTFDCTLHSGKFVKATFMSQVGADLVDRYMADQRVSGLADKCIVPGVILTGVDLPWGTASDDSGCRELCLNTKECAAFTFYTSGRCHLVKAGYKSEGIHTYTMLDSNIGDVVGAVSASIDCYK